ncbi:LOW QUALITY PROTEIN: hypothetical protein OSB04_030834 [Centaurea solstitialis]|uniref:Reverse transcriptase Ty1/copia-type domain-containing protein n=1 Tax=Centaurea solstitialis TaxID=347529 RepID=A0AA38W7J3_9ASTR|nr:LOW QUALITY PROTEIN: hypothetical protein OSB04_030834 [Centaurea solstitialis]
MLITRFHNLLVSPPPSSTPTTTPSPSPTSMASNPSSPTYDIPHPYTLVIAGCPSSISTTPGTISFYSPPPTNKEYRALITNLVPHPSGINIVWSMWLFEQKFNVDDSIAHYKARLVANGKSQQQGITCHDMKLLVWLLNRLQYLLCLPIHPLDVKNAFLHGIPDTRIMYFIYNICCMVSSRHHVDGFNVLPTWSFRLDFKDNIILIASSPTLLQKIISHLIQEFSMSNVGPLNYFLGISTTRTFKAFSVSKYATDILERAHMINCNPSHTPVETIPMLDASGPTVQDPTLFHSLTDALQYLTFTRLDISFAIYLSLSDVLECHWGGGGTTRVLPRGTIFFLSVIIFSLGRQNDSVRTRSSVEVEYHGVAIPNLIGSQFASLKCPPSKAIVVYYDKISVVYMSSNPVQYQRSKHTKTDIHFVHDQLALGLVCVLHVPSSSQFADIFTK